MARLLQRFIKEHASLTLVVVGGFLSLLLHFLLIPVVSFLAPDDFLRSTACVMTCRASIFIGGPMVLAGICLGLWQGISNHGRIS
jgi:hypothetical protein